MNATRREKIEPRTSDAAVKKATGKGREAWFKLLDKWGAEERKHGEIAAWLSDEHDIDGWWAQTLTVDYEQARGLRAPGGFRDGTFAVSASKTVNVAVDQLFEAFTDAKLRKRWLSGAKIRERTAQVGRSARFDWEDGTTRVLVTFTAKDQAKSQVALQHERISSAKAAEKLKLYWRERMAALKELLESD